MKAVLLISHGSRSSKTKEEIISLVMRLKGISQIPIFEYAFLEIEIPSISEGLDICVFKGATEIIVLLNFLNSGRHVNDDIPKIINQAREKHPLVQFTMTQPVGQHPKIDQLFMDLIDRTVIPAQAGIQSKMDSR